jgi:hypothetical protein
MGYAIESVLTIPESDQNMREVFGFLEEHLLTAA